MVILYILVRLVIKLHLPLIDHSNNSKPGSGRAGVFHIYRRKSCLTGLLLAVSSVPSLWLVKSLPLFARRDPGIVLVSAAACTVLVLLSHFPTCFRAFFLFLYCVMKMSGSQVKLRG